MGRAYVIGAGVAGLAAAVALAKAGAAVTLVEGAGQAGGRCRSFFDDVLGCRIDNGNHLLLSGNRSTMAYLGMIGARHSLAGPAHAVFPFLDLQTGDRWQLRLGKSPIPFWIFDPARRVPGTQAKQYGAALKLLTAGRTATVEEVLGGTGELYRRFWEPLSVAVLNTGAHEAAARLLLPVMLETFARGEAACRPRMVREGLSESFVAPALAYLARRHAALRFGQRLVGLDVDGKRATALRFSGGVEHLSRDDVVVLALPPLGASEALPGLTVPTRFTPIVNVHYRLPAAVADPGTPELLGLVGGVAHWLFLRGPVVSVTVSAAEPLVHDDAEAIAQRIWPEIERALGLQGPLPPYRVVKERRATFAQTPEALLARPATRTPLANLVLAGDWTQTGLPATIEGAIRSGFSAARALGAGHRLSSAHGPAVAPREAGRPAAA